MRVQLYMHDTSMEILMMYEFPVQTSRTHTCAIARARHEYRNIRYMLLCARKIDDVPMNCLCQVKTIVTRDQSVFEAYRS